MYRFPVRNLEGTALNIVYIHPTFTDYGVGFRVEHQPQESFVRCDVVTGDIQNKKQLRTLEDFSAPLDVMLWALNAMRIIQNNTVNTASIDIDDLFANHGGKVVYDAAPAAPATSETEADQPQADQDSKNTEQSEADTEQVEEDSEDTNQESTS